MIDLDRQAWLNNRPFESLAAAIAAKDPRDVMARISFDHDSVTGSLAPSDLFHEDIEQLRASPSFQARLASKS
jgi:hypothetical protein